MEQHTRSVLVIGASSGMGPVYAEMPADEGFELTTPRYVPELTTDRLAA